MARYTPMDWYNTAVTSGTISNDEKQRYALEKLDALHLELLQYSPVNTASQGFFALWGNFLSKFKIKAQPRTHNPVKGFYMYGSVGCGKTVLLKAFYETSPTDKKLYMHFHDFLLYINTELAKLPSDFKGDRIEAVAKSLLDTGWLFCLDECVIADVGDGLLFGRIASFLISAGGVIVTTSNFSPSNLNPKGAGADVFKPYKDIFFAHMQTHNMDSALDYRKTAGRGQWQYFLTPLGQDTDHQLEKLLQSKNADSPPCLDFINVRGHTVSVYKIGDGIAQTDAGDILQKAYGIQDFMAIADTYNILILKNMYAIESGDTTTAKRFILLVDAFYERSGTIIVTADVDVMSLNPHNVIATEFARAISRLHQMQA